MAYDKYISQYTEQASSQEGDQLVIQTNNVTPDYKKYTADTDGVFNITVNSAKLPQIQGGGFYIQPAGAATPSVAGYLQIFATTDNGGTTYFNSTPALARRSKLAADGYFSNQEIGGYNINTPNGAGIGINAPGLGALPAGFYEFNLNLPLADTTSIVPETAPSGSFALGYGEDGNLVYSEVFYANISDAPNMFATLAKPAEDITPLYETPISCIINFTGMTGLITEVGFLPNADLVSDNFNNAVLQFALINEDGTGAGAIASLVTSSTGVDSTGDWTEFKKVNSVALTQAYTDSQTLVVAIVKNAAGVTIPSGQFYVVYRPATMTSFDYKTRMVVKSNKTDISKFLKKESKYEFKF